MKIELFYDRDCPFCNSYANYIKLKKEHDLHLINARESKRQIDEFRKKGFDINEGFIIEVEKIKLYQGVDAIIFLNKLANRKVFFPDNLFFRYILYPIIKFFRKLVLFFLRKKAKI